MNQLSEVLNIMDGAWRGDTDKVERYAELLATKLDAEGETKQAELVRNKILQMQGKLKPIFIVPMDSTMSM